MNTFEFRNQRYVNVCKWKGEKRVDLREWDGNKPRHMRARLSSVSETQRET